ncbi:hypothetical protein DKM44_01735 [Deinococcus irradiatisoli]|uniref:Uncharacterized protein n=1 Tax=Deinococcus irradiatisoli TaxID=2202254 RepID=A0A2Z3JGW3_9DEIO|nr:hypothetical protein DKM44_01735 [Deinococcus irradiatisoli]
MRYIITRPCLSEGTLTVAKYLRGLFPESLAGQTLHLSDEHERDYPVKLSDDGKRLSGLGLLYHDHNLDVNDVLLLSPISEGRYRVSCVVKPHTERLGTLQREKPAELTRRVVVNATPHVREVRLERAAPPETPAPRVSESRSDETREERDATITESRRLPEAQVAVSPAPAPRVASVRATRPAEVREAALPAEAALRRPGSLPRSEPPRPGTAPATPRSSAPESLPPLLETVDEQLSELARLTGYQLEYLGGAESGPVRLRADLGTHGYDVMLALSEAERQHPAFAKGTYRALLSWEKDSVSGARFTREALGALLEHARLAPLTPIDLRGYWNTASFDLDSVASLAELVSAHLVQRGTFTYVLGTLAQQPAHSLVDPARLAERLGSGVNKAELQSILETLCRAPFMALLPLPGGQFYLRSDVPALLAELSDYAQGVSRRLQPQARTRA